MFRSALFTIISSVVLTSQALAVCVQPLLVSKDIDSTLTKFKVSADSSELNNGVYDLVGGVNIESNRYIISGDSMKVDTNAKTYEALGNVRMRTDNITVQSEALHLEAGDELRAQADSLVYIYDALANGTATEVAISELRESLKDATYTTCNTQQPAWQFSAGEIVLDKESNRGRATHASFDIFGVSLFTLPEYEWVLAGRESGALFPSVSSYKRNGESGYSVSLPYYFNLAPHYDMTLTPRIVSLHGTTLGIEYRHLLAATKSKGYFEWNSDVLSDDDKTGKDRWKLNTLYNQTFGDFSLDAKLHRVSDSAYLNDIDLRSGVERLESYAKLSYQRDGWFASLFSEAEQLITGSGLYTKESEVVLNKTLESDDVQYDVSVISTEFNHKDITKVTGQRSFATVQLSTETLKDNMRFTPQVFVHTTQYDLDNASDAQRTIAGVNLNAELLYERNTSLFNTDVVQTLTPRIAYFYNSDKDQTSLPNFDSELQTLRYDSLFANEAWSGLDRVDAANTLALGLQSRMFNSATGDLVLNASIGRNVNLDTKEKSHLFMEAQAQYGKLNIYNSLEYDTKIVARNSLISLNNNGTHFTSIGHHLLNDEEYISLHTALPISGRSHIFGGVKYALGENRRNKQTLGVMYDTCCFAVRSLYAKEYNTTTNTFDSNISFELIFKGLGSSDSNIYDNITQYIPEYSNDSY